MTSSSKKKNLRPQKSTEWVSVGNQIGTAIQNRKRNPVRRHPIPITPTTKPEGTSLERGALPLIPVPKNGNC